MNLGQLHDRINQLMDDPNQDIYTDAIMTPFINRAQEYIVNEIELMDNGIFQTSTTFAVTTQTAGVDQTFALPSDFRVCREVEREVPGARNVPVRNVTHKARNERGAPVNAYFIDGEYSTGGTIGFVSPKNTYTATMWYTKKIPDLSADGDVSIIPAHFHDIIAVRAAITLARSRQEERLVQHLSQEFAEQYHQMKRSLKRRSKQGPRYVRNY